MKLFYLIVFGITGAFALPAQTIPTDAAISDPNKAACSVTAATFNQWFVAGAPSLNGVAKPANSLAFPANPNCDFYQWSKQMFLWLTSPTQHNLGGGGGRIFDSSMFFDVSPPNSTRQRMFIPHTPGFIRFMAIRVPKLGPHQLPVVFDTKGRMLEVERPRVSPLGKQLIRDQSGNFKEVGRITLTADRRLLFQDAAGTTIQPMLAQTSQALSRATITVQKFMVDGQPVFVGPGGSIIDVEQGQSNNSGVLMAQNGSLVYYATMVNDVYAYFLTGLKDNGISPKPTHFPTSQGDLNAITAFASAHHKTFSDGNALVVEVKTSWVEAAGLPNLTSYITMRATIPTYNKSNPSKWVLNGQKTVGLALVGMHVVGSTVGKTAAGHPEMIWATFEHFGNTPNAAYSYNTLKGTVTVPQNTAGVWLFAASGASGPFNVPHMEMESDGANIVPITFPSKTTISSSNTIRSQPWGMPGQNALSNTEVISIHNSINSMMPAGDVRNNYFMTGATWTKNGAVPPALQVGTALLANTTMETYQQSRNCLGCHVTLDLLGQQSLSHVSADLKPLF